MEVRSRYHGNVIDVNDDPPQALCGKSSVKTPVLRVNYDITTGCSRSHDSVTCAFGQRLRRLIDESPYKGESQRRLGRTFGVSGPTVNEWLKGKKMPGIETAIRVALVLDVCVEYLLTGRGPKQPNSNVSAPSE